MTINDFEQLTKAEKIIAVLRNATPLLFISNEKEMLSLYYLSNHFIEVRLDEQFREVQCVSIIGYKQLDIYLHQLIVPL